MDAPTLHRSASIESEKDNQTSRNTSREHDAGAQRPYWPFVLSFTWFAVTLCFILALITGLEVAARKLPINPRVQNKIANIVATPDLSRTIIGRSHRRPTYPSYVLSQVSASTIVQSTASSTSSTWESCSTTTTIISNELMEMITCSSPPPDLRPCAGSAPPGDYVAIWGHGRKARRQWVELGCIPMSDEPAIDSRSRTVSSITSTSAAMLPRTSYCTTFSSIINWNTMTTVICDCERLRLSGHPTLQESVSEILKQDIIVVSASRVMFGDSTTQMMLRVKQSTTLSIPPASRIRPSPAAITTTTSTVNHGNNKALAVADMHHINTLKINCTDAPRNIGRDGLLGIETAVTLETRYLRTTGNGTIVNFISQNGSTISNPKASVFRIDTRGIHAVDEKHSSNATTFDTAKKSGLIIPASLSKSTDAMSRHNKSTKAQPDLTSKTDNIVEPIAGAELISWPRSRTFAGNYLAVLLAVVLKFFWTPVLTNARMMDPFIALSRPRGACLKQVLFSGYFSTTLIPLKMVKHQGSLLFAATANTAIIALIVPLASEAIILDTNWDCPNPNLTSKNPCWPPRVSVDPPIVRLLQALLCATGLVAVAAMVIILISVKPKLSQDPSSIVGVMALIHHPTLIRDLQAGDPEASTDTWAKSTPNRRLTLQGYAANDILLTGIIPLVAEQHELMGDNGCKQSHKHATRERTLFPLMKKCRISWDVFLHIGITVLSLALLGLVVAYYLDVSDSGFNRYFNSNTFGPRFVFTSIATMLSLGFESLQFDIVLTAPFRAIAQRPQPASSTIRLRKHALPLVSALSFLRHAYYFPAFFSIIAALVDILVILAGVIPYSPGQIWTEYLVSTYTCMSILALMAFCLFGLVFWKRGLKIPRKPDTLGAVMSYLCSSKEMEIAASIQHGSKGTKYVFGHFEGDDGISRWSIIVA